MNKNSFDGAYQAPEISIIDINAEGVLCMSIQDLEDDKDPLFC